jgi:hypothetical protein
MRIQGATLARTALILITICFMPWFGSAAEAAQEAAAKSSSKAFAHDEDLTAFKRLRGNLIQLTGQIERRRGLFGPRPALVRANEATSPSSRRAPMDFSRIWHSAKG